MCRAQAQALVASQQACRSWQEPDAAHAAASELGEMQQSSCSTLRQVVLASPAYSPEAAMFNDSRTSTVACQLLVTDAVLRDGPYPAGLLPSGAAGRPLPLPLDGNVPPHSAGLAGDSEGMGSCPGLAPAAAPPGGAAAPSPLLLNTAARWPDNGTADGSVLSASAADKGPLVASSVLSEPRSPRHENRPVACCAIACAPAALSASADRPMMYSCVLVSRGIMVATMPGRCCTT